MRFSNAGVTIELSRQRRRRLRDLPIIPCWPPPLGRRTRPEPLTLKRLDAALLVFILGMSSSQGGRLYSIRPANGALFLHPQYGFWMGLAPRVELTPGNRSAPGPPRRVAACLASSPALPSRAGEACSQKRIFRTNHGFWTLTSLVALGDGLGYCAVARRRHGKHEPTLADAAPLPGNVVRQMSSDRCRQAKAARKSEMAELTGSGSGETIALLARGPLSVPHCPGESIRRIRPYGRDRSETDGRL